MSLSSSPDRNGAKFTRFNSRFLGLFLGKNGRSREFHIQSILRERKRVAGSSEAGGVGLRCAQDFHSEEQDND